MPALARSIAGGLTDEGYAVDHAADGLSASESLEAGGYDLVILDWWLPHRDGLAVLHRHREAGGRTAVLFLTAKDAVSDRVAGLDAGADDYLCKPFAFEELLARARALIRRGESRDGTLDLPGRADRPGDPASRAGRSAAGSDREGNRPSWPSSSATPARLSHGAGSTRASGARNTTSSRTRSRFTSRNCARKLETHGPRLIQTHRGQGYVLGDPPIRRGGTEP